MYNNNSNINNNNNNNTQIYSLLNALLAMNIIVVTLYKFIAQLRFVFFEFQWEEKVYWNTYSFSDSRNLYN